MPHMSAQVGVNSSVSAVPQFSGIRQVLSNSSSLRKHRQKLLGISLGADEWSSQRLGGKS